MGLGPNGSSLRERCGMPPPVWSNPFAMQMEAQERGEARAEKALWYRMRNTTPRKPEAPVAPAGKAAVTDTTTKRGYRMVQQWVWEGEDVPSKGIVKGTIYLAQQLREKGFKMPKLGEQKA